MKILFVCENYYPHLGGAEILFKNLAEGLSKQGHQVSVLTHQIKGTKKIEALNNVEIHRISSLDSRYLFTFTSIWKAIKMAQRHDLIQTTTFNGAFPAWLAGKISRRPVVLTVHEVWAGKWKEVTEFSWLKSRVHDLLERMIYLLSFDRYVCVSHATKRDLMERGIKEPKIEVVYNGIDYSFWNHKKVTKKEKELAREKLGLKDKKIYFSWGRPGASKGFEYVIEAFPQVSAKVQDAAFVLMLGSPERYKKKYLELLRLIEKKSAGGNKNIKLISSVSYPELRALLAAVDYVVIPSITEGFGYAVAEAAALNKPIVISDAGSLPEVVSGKHLIFSAKNSSDLAEKMIKTSLGEYQETGKKRFEWNKTLSGYLNTYRELLQKSPDKGLGN